MKKLTILLVLPVFFCTRAFSQDYPDKHPAKPVRVLLLMDDDYGANYNVDDESMNIDELLKGFGWVYDIAALKDTVYPCETAVNYFHREPVAVDLHVNEVDLSQYEVLMIMPGRSHKNLLQSKEALQLVREAVLSGIIVAGWCRGVRILAKADVISGRRITGHDDFIEEYKSAGATFIPEKPPPVIDGNIITTVRSRYYRTEMMEKIRKSVSSE